MPLWVKMMSMGKDHLTATSSNSTIHDYHFTGCTRDPIQSTANTGNGTSSTFHYSLDELVADKEVGRKKTRAEATT